ncbi:Hypothetical protein POVR1_LOCUS334 [uncultured virus]|nr:Hypothetical protein POVR1_LOCUS334 [uncultured virus]
MSNQQESHHPFEIPELVGLILSFCHYREIVVLIQTVKICQRIADNLFWKTRIQKEYPSLIIDRFNNFTTSFTYKQLYEDCFRCYLCGVDPSQYVHLRSLETISSPRNLGPLVFVTFDEWEIDYEPTFVQQDEHLILEALFTSSDYLEKTYNQYLEGAIKHQAPRCAKLIVNRSLPSKIKLYNDSGLSQLLLETTFEVFHAIVTGKMVMNELTIHYLRTLMTSERGVHIDKKLQFLLPMTVLSDERTRHDLILQACKIGNFEVIKVLFADSRIWSLTLTEAFQICVRNLNSDQLYELFSPPDLNYNPSTENNSALCALVSGGSVNAVKMVLQNKKFHSKGYLMVLREATINRSFEILEILLSHHVMFEIESYDEMIREVRSVISFIYGSHRIYHRLSPPLTPFAEILTRSREDLVKRLEGLKFQSSMDSWKKRKLQGICCEHLLKDQSIIHHKSFRAAVMCDKFRFAKFLAEARIPNIKVRKDVRICLLLWLNDRDTCAENYLKSHAPIHLVNYLGLRSTMND